MASEIYLDKLYNKEGTTKVVDLTTSELTNINLTSSVGNLPPSRNLIINGDFRVNQRGAASRTENSNAYNYDRWYYDGTYLYQGVEDKSVANGTYTLSWVDAGSDITAAYIVSTDSSTLAGGDLGDGPDSGLTYTSVSNGGNITVSEGTEYSKHLWIRFGGTLANLSKVQLVYGSVATPFEHKSFGEELAACQRYYYRTSDDGTTTNLITVNNENATRCAGGFPHPVRMRAVPTISLGSGIRYYTTGTGTLTPTLVSNRSNSSHLAVYFGVSGATTDAAGTIYHPPGVANGYLEADAEL